MYSKSLSADPSSALSGNNWEGLAAMDFFAVEALTPRGLIRYSVLFAIDISSRRVEICGIVHRPNDRWILQMVRNLVDVSCSR